FVHCYAAPRDLHSFPTRRSSDLTEASATAALQALPAGHRDHVDPLNKAWRTVPETSGASIALALETALQAKQLEAMSSVDVVVRSEEHTSELQSLAYLVCRLLLE